MRDPFFKKGLSRFWSFSDFLLILPRDISLTPIFYYPSFKPLFMCITIFLREAVALGYFEKYDAYPKQRIGNEFKHRGQKKVQQSLSVKFGEKEKHLYRPVNKGCQQKHNPDTIVDFSCSVKFIIKSGVGGLLLRVCLS